MKKKKNKKKDIPIFWVDDSQYADLPVTKNPDNIITEEEQKQIDEIQKKYKFWGCIGEVMTKDEFWEAINTGGKVYTYNDEIDFYVVFTNKRYEIYLVPVPDSIDSDNYPKYKTFDEMLDKSMILGKSLMECLTQIEC